MKSRGFVHLVDLGLRLVSIMLLCEIVKAVESAGPIEMLKTNCFVKTRLVLHVPSLSQAGKRCCYYYYYHYHMNAAGQHINKPVEY